MNPNSRAAEMLNKYFYFVITQNRVFCYHKTDYPGHFLAPYCPKSVL